MSKSLKAGLSGNGKVAQAATIPGSTTSAAASACQTAPKPSSGMPEPPASPPNNTPSGKPSAPVSAPPSAPLVYSHSAALAGLAYDNGAQAVHVVSGGQVIEVICKDDDHLGRFQLPPGDHIIITIAPEGGPPAVLYINPPQQPTGGAA
jgi:hypothetical protein